MGRGVTSISGIDDLLLIARVKFGEDFNLSRFVREALKAALFENTPIIDPISEAAKRAAETLIQEQRLNEKDLLLKTTNELIEQETRQKRNIIFRERAKGFFVANPTIYIRLLPECNPNISANAYWEKQAEELSVLCGFEVSSDQVMTFVREEL